MIKLSGQEINYITLFEKLTGATVKDCILSEDLTFVIKEGDMGLAIGKEGVIINKIKREMGREIHVYEHSTDSVKFIKNLFYPINIDKVEVNGKNIKVFISPEFKKRVIGRGGKKINSVKEIAKRHLDIEEIQVFDL
jgi:N utilization substance protein A